MNSFQSAWKSNQGNILLIIAAAASVVVSSVWYFDLLPNIEFVSAELPRNVTQTVSNPPAVIVVSLVFPESIGKDLVTGYVRVHAPFGDMPLNLDALAVREFQLIDHRVPPVVFTEVQAGSYALSAFLDLNGNGLLDANEQGEPTEPFRLSNLRNPKSQNLNLEAATISLDRGQTVNLRLDFTM